MALWPESVRDASPLELIQTTALQWLRDDPRMTALVSGRVYTAIPPDAPFPLVLVGSATRIPWPRMGHDGVEATFTCRASSQVRGDYEVLRIADQMAAVIQGRVVAMPPFRTATYLFDNSPGVYAETLAGVVTYYSPVVFRARLTIA